MYKLIRFCNQNRKKTCKIILIIVFAFLLLQLLNYFTKTKSENKNLSNITSNQNNSMQQLLSDKSAISGKDVASSQLQNETSFIDEFMTYCKNKDVQNAYELLTDECKEEMFPTLEDFIKIYYNAIFNEENKSYTIENWTRSIYKVNITGDILATGKLDSTETKQDYITIVRKGDKYKININNYIGREEINKTTEDRDIKIIVLNKDIYMDYEEYNLEISNNSENAILLDVGNNTKSVYLLDSKDVKYYFYSNEINQNKLIIQSKYKNRIKVKFMNSYSSSRNIKSLVFSQMILNYDEYKNVEDKLNYDNIYEFRAKL